MYESTTKRCLLCHDLRAGTRADEGSDNCNGIRDMRRRVFAGVRDRRLQSQPGRGHNCLRKLVLPDCVLHGHPDHHYMLSRVC